MKTILPICLILAAATPALAWEQRAFSNKVQWTFQGSEIQSYSVLPPQESEDPMVLKVGLRNQQQGYIVAEIEADLGLGSCPATLSSATGNPAVTVVLLANLDATTLNGVTLEQCYIQ
jgi:hypothetical protein